MKLLLLSIGFVFVIGSTPIAAQSPDNVPADEPNENTEDDNSSTPDEKQTQPTTSQSTIKTAPRVLAHSEIRASIFQGDKLTLQTKVTGDSLVYRWIRDYRTICRKDTCTFSTEKWGIGNQVITAVIYNRLESRTINFFVKVLARPDDQEPKDVIPKLVKPKETEKINKGDFSVSALFGIGYSNVGRKIKVISKLPASLRWNEKLRSHVKGLLAFGIKGTEEHLLMPKSLVELAETDSGRRIINIQRGEVRSRQLNGKESNWSILSDDWIQVDGDENADIIVQRKNKSGTKVAVYVLRGNARVYYTKKVGDKGDNSVLGESITIPSGSQVRFIRGKSPSRLYAPNSQTLVDIFSQSTPQYIPVIEGKKRKKPSAFITENIRSKRDQPLKSAILTSKKLLQERDYILVIENLLPLVDKAKSNYEYSLLLAKAYRDLGIFNPSIAFFNHAKAIEPNNPAASYELGVLYMSARRWELAAEELTHALELGYTSNQLIQYYLGVAHFNMDQKLEARNYFKRSLWEPENEDIEISSRKFMQLLKGQQKFGATLSLGFGKDSNVYRWGSDERTPDYKTESSLYYEASANPFYRFYGGTDGEVKIGYDARIRRYIDSDLKDVEILDQRLHLDWNLMLSFDETHTPAFDLYVEPFIGLFSYGAQRAADRFGYDIRMGFRQLWGAPTIKYFSASVVDPVPGYFDKLDPIRHEPTIASDRSGTESRYALNLSLYDGLTTDLQSELSYGSFVHKKSTVSIDDFTHYGLDIMSQFKISHTMKMIWDLGYHTRDFAKSDDSRKDTIVGTDLGFRYFYTPSLFNDLRAEYTSLNSSSSSHSYKRYDIGLFLTLEL